MSGCEKTNSLKSLRYAKKIVFLRITNLLHQMPVAPKIDRFQFHFSSLEDAIACDNPVRFLDTFVDKLQFPPQTIKTEGRPAFEHQVFLTLKPLNTFNNYQTMTRPTMTSMFLIFKPKYNGSKR
jgi:hypothetical protein